MIMHHADMFVQIYNENHEYIFRLICAMVFGGVVGFERQVRGRSAGLRTNILVCLGSAAVIVVFQKLSEFSFHNPAIRFDPARAAAGVITGIGFLGAGTIMKSKDFVRGLTTAASIWVVSAVGVTVGLGEYVISFTLTFLVLVALYFFHRLKIKEDRYFTLKLKWQGELALLDEVIEILKKEHAAVKGRKVTVNPQSETVSAEISLRIHYFWFENQALKSIQKDRRFSEVIWE
jgi:putative Mg2+ transporter-C (MgtC) family protein